MTKAVRWSAEQLAEYLRRTKVEKVAPAPDLPPSRAKYGNRKVEDADGVTHDSKKEARRWAELQQRQAAGEISELRRQVPFVLAPAVRLDGEARMKPALRYVCDFCYIQDGKLMIEDVKSAPTRKTAIYRAKKHLMATVHGLQISEK